MIPGSLNSLMMSAGAGNPFFANVVLQMHFDGTDGSTAFTEVTGKTATVNGNAQIDTAVKKYGAGSGLFDGAGDYLTFPDDAGWQFGTGDFTIEGWLYLNSNTATEVVFYYGNGTTANLADAGWAIYHNPTNGIVFTFNNGTTQYNVISLSPLTISTMTFVQVVRESGVVKIRIGGSEVKTQSQPQTMNTPASSLLYLGRRQDIALAYLNSNVDDWRITKGVAMPNAVPTDAFPDSV